MELRYNMKDSGYLEHYGVLGMKWGVRKDDYAGLSRSILREDLSNSARLLKAFGKTATKSAISILMKSSLKATRSIYRSNRDNLDSILANMGPEIVRKK